MSSEVLRLLILIALVLGAKGEEVDVLIDVRDGNRCVYYDSSQLPTYYDENLGEWRCYAVHPSVFQCESSYGGECPWIPMTEEEFEEFEEFRYKLMMWAYRELWGQRTSARRPRVRGRR